MTASSDNKAGASAMATAAEMRGAIEHGKTGDKIAGFDPAASPMETDGEAGGAPSIASHEARMGAGSPLRNPNATSHGDAMRPFEDAAHPRLRKPLFLFIALIALLAIILLAGIAMWH